MKSKNVNYRSGSDAYVGGKKLCAFKDYRFLKEGGKKRKNLQQRTGLIKNLELYFIPN